MKAQAKTINGDWSAFMDVPFIAAAAMTVP